MERSPTSKDNVTGGFAGNGYSRILASSIPSSHRASASLLPSVLSGVAERLLIVGYVILDWNESSVSNLHETQCILRSSVLM